MKRNYLVGGVLITFEETDTDKLIVRLDNHRSGSNIVTLGATRHDLLDLKSAISDVIRVFGGE